jgi:phospholipase C
MPPIGLDNLRHLVVLMMENRSFDHMFGGLRPAHPGIDIWPNGYTNPDTKGNEIPPQPKAEYQGQLDPDPNHDFAPVNEQIFNGGATPDMRGFIRSYFKQRNNVKASQRIMYYFKPSQLPVLSNLALEYVVFNRWFASIPGPTLCNRAFAHYGTSFGHVGMEMKYFGHPIKSIYERLRVAGRTTKLYYFDRASSTLELINLLQDQPQIFATYEQFLADCHAGTLPDYAFVEPNYSDHDGLIASDQHPDHHVAEGERFIASIYMAIKSNPALWPNTALLITYDEHGGIFDHVPPPSPDGKDDSFEAPADKTGTGQPFKFDRLGVRVPAILVSPWATKGRVINDVYEHASIPATATEWLLPGFAGPRTDRETKARTFLHLLSEPVMRTDGPNFV